MKAPPAIIYIKIDANYFILQIDESKYVFLDDDWKRISESDSGVSILFFFFGVSIIKTNNIVARRK